MAELKTVFKVGDKVFDIRYGKGEVVFENTINAFDPKIRVKFIGIAMDYFISGNDIKLLSFTEYDLINRGWSQDRSVLNQPKKGQLVYVRNGKIMNWQMQFFSHKQGDLFICIEDQQKEGNPEAWEELEVENPLLKEKE